MLVKGMYKSKSYNFCFKQLTMNFIYIGSLASSIRSTATIKQFIRPSLYRGVCAFGYGGTALFVGSIIPLPSSGGDVICL